ncbi:MULTISPECIES: hypothetical protein [Aphanothece]|uniref:hypothetical protein n=1 Tax=Aphanothece TaxID=1121 RepID=UPI003984E052
MLVLSFPVHSSSHLDCESVESLSILGTVHSHRNRWNPFCQANDMIWDGHRGEWWQTFFLHPRGGRHGNGIYNFRFVGNHNPSRVFKKAADEDISHGLIRLVESAWGEAGRNITLQVNKPCEYRLSVDTRSPCLKIIGGQVSEFAQVNEASSFQLNGFVWDGEDMFGKFDECRPSRSFEPHASGSWFIDVELRKNGGIDFRSDGVYQFLISRNHDEDQGFSAINRPSSAHARISKALMWERIPDADQTDADQTIDLIQGSGFGSSHGRCLHSAATVAVSEDGTYRFWLKAVEDGMKLTVEPLQGGAEVRVLNRVDSVQLLGSVHNSAPFDPTNQATFMQESKGKNGIYELTLDVKAGDHVINFGLAHELFLDTMGLGCWIGDISEQGIQGVAWHGKPNEANICFQVQRDARIQFVYDLNTDRFSLHCVDGNQCLHRIDGLDSLSIVGSFAEPLIAWSPKEAENRMQKIGGERFERYIFLDADSEYQFKFVANLSDWHLVFADYELDGYGASLSEPNNPSPMDSSLEQLKKHGHLTSHGNPPPISFKPSRTGWHRFVVDMNTGAYSVNVVL